MRWQFAESVQNDLLKRVEFMLNFGMGLRFRPWREEMERFLKVPPIPKSQLFKDNTLESLQPPATRKKSR
ncbi:hypothetical protein R83H12_02904 [Fibrobacteria bacterium R8-3-H12]